jgi:hypothetical protein
MMRIKRLIAIVIMLSVIPGIALLQAQDSADSLKATGITSEKIAADSSGKTVAEKESAKADRVVAYYFYGNRRCASCKKIEAYSQAAIEEGFAEELKKGTLEFIPINTDEKENKHYTKDYQLYTKSLIVSKIVNGDEIKWKNLTGVWQLLNTEKGFKQYVQDEIGKYLKEK